MTRRKKPSRRRKSRRTVARTTMARKGSQRRRRPRLVRTRRSALRASNEVALLSTAAVAGVPGLNAVVDLSHHNASVSFAKAKADGIVGVIYKATQGTNYIDPTYAARRTAALGEGLLWGAYHFGTGASGEAQAKHFLDTVQPDRTTLLALDFEADPQGPDMTLEQAHAFISYVFTKTGRYPGLYGGHYLKQLLGSTPDSLLGRCWFWLSQYGPTPVVPNTWQTWTLWQYTDGAAGPTPHSVAGIGRCDRDTFQGNLAALKALWRA